jgi:hypothetical protein
VLVASHFSLAYIADTTSFLSLPRFAAGMERQPFQERALTAWLLRGVLRFDGPVAEERIHHLLPALGSSFTLASMTLLLLCWASMAGAILLTRLSVLRLTSDHTFSLCAAFLPPYMAYFTYILYYGPHFLLPYDLPALFFFCLGMYLILCGRSAALVPLMAVATLNRETAIFLAVFYVLFRWDSGASRRRRIEICLWASAMALTWVAMRAIVLGLYGHNPHEGRLGSAQLHLWQNLGFLFKPQHWPALLSTFGFALPLVLVRARLIRPAGLRRGLIAVGLWFTLMLVVGVVIEIRIYGELISYVALATAAILYPVLGRGGAAGFTSPGPPWLAAPDTASNERIASS